ncbi:MAG: DNA repair protein RadC [Bacteroidales bacterium]|jgi:DNA repair protein RadC|nr:DNA repair protein RadC [Bacteroidales bacterium]
MKIKELEKDDRPREKMEEKGASALSNTELIAILLRSGTGKVNAVDLARNLMKEAGGDLTILSKMSVERMCVITGIGHGKALSILAAMELGRRYFIQKPSIEKVSITNSDMIYRKMIPVMKGLDHEEFWIVYLNRANFIIGKEMVSSGGLSSTVVDSRIIVRKAVEKEASGIIMVHNHPSGNPQPGTADIKTTENLKRALCPFEISVLDHIVVCDDCYFSFADNSINSAS